MKMKTRALLVTTSALIALLLAVAGGVHAAELPASKNVQALAFLALTKPVLPNPDKVRTALQRRLGTVKIDEMETDKQSVILFRLQGGTIMVGLVDAPLPKDEIAHTCKWTWHWKDACDAMAPNKGHLIVTVLHTHLDKLEAALLLTNAIAAMMDDNAIASYWGTSLHSKSAFLKQSENASKAAPPVWLWVNIRLTHDLEKGWTASTDGMDNFDLHEIESKDVNVDGKKLFRIVLGMAAYLIMNGPVIKDGDTFGDSALENIKVRRSPSYWDEKETVYRIVFPQP